MSSEQIRRITGRYGFGWGLLAIRGHKVVGHGGVTGTAILRLPDDKLTVIVLTNLHARSGTGAVEIAHGVAGCYIPGLLPSSSQIKPNAVGATPIAR